MFPRAVLTLPCPAARSADPSPLAVRASREPRSPLHRMSAEAAFRTQDEPRGSRTTRSSDVLLSSRTRSGTAMISVPASNSTVVASMSSSPRLPERDASATVAVVTGSALTVMLPAGSLASRLIGSGAGKSQVVIGLFLRCSSGWVWGTVGRVPGGGGRPVPGAVRAGRAGVGDESAGEQPADRDAAQRGIDDLGDVGHRQPGSPGGERRGDLQRAARVRRDNQLRPGGLDRAGLPLAELAGGLRLDQVVDAG